MKIDNKTGQDSVLDLDTLELLGSAPDVLTATLEDPAHRRDRVLAFVDQECALPSYLTIRNNTGIWIEQATGGEKKTLTVDERTGMESYLLRLRPGETVDEHHHEEDELCFVVEGDVSSDSLQLNAGDFHFARKGSIHGEAMSVHGALMFIQSKVTFSHAVA